MISGILISYHLRNECIAETSGAITQLNFLSLLEIKQKPI